MAVGRRKKHFITKATVQTVTCLDKYAQQSCLKRELESR